LKSSRLGAAIAPILPLRALCAAPRALGATWRRLRAASAGFGMCGLGPRGSRWL
jgi:hypothetical protein